MSKLKIAWLALLLILFGAFWYWYGGTGDPLSVEEGTAMLDEIEAAHEAAGNPRSMSDFRANIEAMLPNDDGGEFYAVNLEQLREGPEAEAADAAYARAVFPALLKRGAIPIYVGDTAGLMLGQYGAEVDRVAIVRYRSLRDMLDMNLDPGMIAGVPHKFASLDHTEVFITRATLSAVHVRLTLALVLLVIGFLGLKLIDRMRGY
ncbi:hypothetical protein HFP51_12565 [Parasphingopyxis sp. CP4]|uniref:hypothetical protein n=1 Tax=Parasphingopyxis sp. CP4 TaxID=2724527 RepID=UPI0015A23E3D|nr:hypothetical protein [Parasphingopyxis sp. CP4]QLC22944.1 hypothetical protein HFP51_12565 [Parasphingopyxis sp. CP4]